MTNNHKPLLSEDIKRQIHESKDMSILLPNLASIRVMRDSDNKVCLATAFHVHKEIESDAVPIEPTSWYFNAAHLRQLAEVLNFIADTMETSHD